MATPAPGPLRTLCPPACRPRPPSLGLGLLRLPRVSCHFCKDVFLPLAGGPRALEVLPPPWPSPLTGAVRPAPRRSLCVCPTRRGPSLSPAPRGSGTRVTPENNGAPENGHGAQGGSQCDVLAAGPALRPGAGVRSTPMDAGRSPLPRPGPASPRVSLLTIFPLR